MKLKSPKLKKLAASRTLLRKATHAVLTLVGVATVSAAVRAAPSTATAAFQTPTLGVPRASPTTKPSIDARADDPAWGNAAVIQSLPLCKGPASRGLIPSPTEVRVMWDDDDLFVRFRCVDDHLYAPHGTATDVLQSDGDVAEIFIDPVGDQRQFFEIQCNPVGGHVDGLHVLTTQPISDADGVLAASVVKRDQWFFQGWELTGLRIAGAAFDDGRQKGWIADFALPAGPILHRLAMNNFAPMALRINFIRYDVTPASNGKAKQAVDMAWSPVPWGRPHRSPALMGTIELNP